MFDLLYNIESEKTFFACTCAKDFFNARARVGMRARISHHTLCDRSNSAGVAAAPSSNLMKTKKLAISKKRRERFVWIFLSSSSSPRFLLSLECVSLRLCLTVRVCVCVHSSSHNSSTQSSLPSISGLSHPYQPASSLCSSCTCV